MRKFFSISVFHSSVLCTKTKTLALLQHMTSAHWYQQAAMFVHGKRGREMLVYQILLISDMRLGYKKRVTSIDGTQSLSDINAL